jgi:CheY-like chemotaxis protein
VVAEVGDALEAVQNAQELNPDSILLDIRIPGVDGLKTANRIRQVARKGTGYQEFSYTSAHGTISAARSERRPQSSIPNRRVRSIQLALILHF